MMAAAAEVAAEDHMLPVPEESVSVLLVVIRFNISWDNHVIR